MDSFQATYYTADSLAFIAKDAAERSADAASVWDPLVAVVFSAIMIEAAVNEVLHTVTNDHGPLPESVRRLKEFSRSIRLDDRRTSLHAKIQTIATLLSGEPLNEGEQPYKDFDLLIAARNFLVHHRPERSSRATDSSEWQVSKLIRRLESHGFRSARVEIDVPSGVELLRQEPVASWAYATAVATVQTTLDHFPKEYRISRHLDPSWATTTTRRDVGSSPDQRR
jgi:hypothetical protein